MNKPPKTSEELVAEFKRIDEEYRELREKHDREVAGMLQRRRIIIQELVHNDGVVPARTHREVGILLGLSTGRIGQLVRESPGYVSPRPGSP